MDTTAPIARKIELRFNKTGLTRFLSHLDLMRAVQRAARRAGLPVRQTGGFNPRPRMVVPLPLETGIGALNDVLYIELDQDIEPDEALRRLNAEAPDGLSFSTARDIEPVKRAPLVNSAVYRLSVRDAGIRVEPDAVKQFLEAASVPFERDKQGQKKTIDLRPSVRALWIEDGDLFTEISTKSGSYAKPHEVLSALTAKSITEVVGAPVTRIETVLETDASDDRSS